MFDRERRELTMMMIMMILRVLKMISLYLISHRIPVTKTQSSYTHVTSGTILPL